MIILEHIPNINRNHGGMIAPQEWMPSLMTELTPKKSNHTRGG